MIEKVSVKEFKAVPHLETSALMQRYGGELTFSLTKPNVIVGPNGAGKSALMQSLALAHLAYYLAYSSFDNNYVLDGKSSALWSETSGWGADKWQFLAGLACHGDRAPVRYYRPHHIPGNQHSHTHAMMSGYSEKAREQANLVEKKSSGQQCQALLQSMLKALSGSDLPCGYAEVNWRFGLRPEKFDATHFVCSFDYQAEVLKALYANVTGGIPAILMDEPEQSLDARAELQLWHAIARADCSKMQVIVATHSLYPFLAPEAFNIVEAEDGYLAQVRDLVKR